MTQEPPETSGSRLKLALAGGLIALAGLVLWLQYRPRSAGEETAAAEVQKLEDARDVNGLTQLTKSQDAGVAAQAVTALGNVAGPEAVRDSLGDPRKDVRAAAVMKLGESADPAHIDTLAKHLTRDPERDVRLAAMASLARMRDFSAVERLLDSLSDPDVTVRRLAVQTLEDRLGRKFTYYDPEGDPGRRAAAVGAIRRMAAESRGAFDGYTERPKANAARSGNKGD